MKSKKIGWIGTGIMGNPMVGHIIQAGYKVNVYNRTKSKTKNLEKIGANIEDSISDLVKNSDIIFTIIGDPSSVENIYFGEGGIVNSINNSKIIVDMTTTKPSLAENIYLDTKNLDCSFLDAPVSGGDVGAINATLSIMVGGEKEIFEKMQDLFSLMGKTIIYCGEAGKGQHTKMANQISVASNTIAICEALLYAEKTGLDIENTIKIISRGAGGSRGWNNLAPRIQAGEFDTGFFIKHFVKDLRIVLDECRNMNLVLPGVNTVHMLYTSLVSHGDKELGTQALMKILKTINNID